MSKDKSSGDSEAVSIISEEGELDEIAFENMLGSMNPMDLLSEKSDQPDESAPKTDKSSKTEEDEPDESEETEEQSEDEEVEEVEEEGGEDESEESDDDDSVLSQIDPEQIPEAERTDVAKAIFDTLSDEQKKEFMRDNGSSVGEELGKLRAKLRSADEKSKKLQSQLEKGLSEVLPINNALSQFRDEEAFDKEVERINGWKNYLDDLLLNSTDEEFEINGNWVKRGELATAKRSYDKLSEDIPKQRKIIKELKNISELKGSELEAAKAEVPFLKDEDSSEFKEWKDFTSSDEFEIMSTAFPKLGAKLARHVARSIAFKKKPSLKNIKIPTKKAKVVSGKSTGGSSSPNGGGRLDKKRLAAEKRIKSGDYTDEDLFAGITHL